jgi:hypothetical protein
MTLSIRYGRQPAVATAPMLLVILENHLRQTRRHD